MSKQDMVMVSRELLESMRDGAASMGWSIADDIHELLAQPAAQHQEPVVRDERADLALAELDRVAHELKNYNPKADDYKGMYIYRAWASRIRQARAALEQKK